jgi:hypothetical protein
MVRVPSTGSAFQGSDPSDGAGSMGPNSVSAGDKVLDETLTEPPALRGRADIDTAVVEALRHAMAPGFSESPCLGARCPGAASSGW